MRKVYVDVKIRLIINMDDGIEAGKVLEEMEYDFQDTTGNADVIETEIRDFQVVDSKK